MDKVLQEKLKAELLQRQEKLSYLEDHAGDLKRRAGRVDNLYDGNPTPRGRSYRSRAKLIIEFLQKEEPLIEKALSELEKGKPQKAQEVLQREIPSWLSK